MTAIETPIARDIQFNRKWAMPNSDTFEVLPIRQFVWKYLRKSARSIDPFSRNQRLASERNDINPNTLAEYHLDARVFLKDMLRLEKADLIIFDPPYSPRQIKEQYESAGLSVNGEDTQNAKLYSECRTLFRKLLTDNGIVLSFGWNTVGMGKGFEILEILMVCHGGAHNDTICMAEQRIPDAQLSML